MRPARTPSAHPDREAMTSALITLVAVSVVVQIVARFVRLRFQMRTRRGYLAVVLAVIIITAWIIDRLGVPVPLGGVCVLAAIFAVPTFDVGVEPVEPYWAIWRWRFRSESYGS